MPQLAIKWYRKGLDISEITEDEHLGSLHLGFRIYGSRGPRQRAETFMEVYGLNRQLRDIARG